MIDFENIQDDLPFLTGFTYGGNEYVGIMQNQDQQLTSFYDYSQILTADQKKEFLHLGNVWWWESNRKIPINLFLPNEMRDFRYCLIHAATKDVEIMFGPVTSIGNLVSKKIKKRQIQFIRRVA